MARWDGARAFKAFAGEPARYHDFDPVGMADADGLFRCRVCDRTRSAHDEERPDALAPDPDVTVDGLLELAADLEAGR